MPSARNYLTAALLLGACGGPTGQAATTTGITTVQPPETTAETTEASTSSSSSTTHIGDSSTSTADTTTSSTSSADLPGFETLGPVKGCGKIDLLFVIDDAGGLQGPVAVESSTHSAQVVRDSVNPFITAMQEQAAGYDLQVMVVKGDPKWSGVHAYDDCCKDEKPCDELGPFPCDPPPGVPKLCDSTLGSGVVFPAGYMASNRNCELAGGHRYITQAQEDFSAAFDCILNVGRTGSENQLTLGAMVKAVGPKLTGVEGCNEGFIRPDAMLVVIVIAYSTDTVTPGTPEGLAASLIAAKAGYADGIVVVGIVGSVDYSDDDVCADVPDQRTRKFVEGFPNHVLGSFCAPDIGVYLSQAIGVIQTACESFVPPG